MDIQEIIRCAKEASLQPIYSKLDVPDERCAYEDWDDELERFAALVAEAAAVKPCCGEFQSCQKVCMPRAAAAEREACAKVCEGIGDGNKGSDAHDCAAAIRARGN
jgi:hypothetical protein